MPTRSGMTANRPGIEAVPREGRAARGHGPGKAPFHRESITQEICGCVPGGLAAGRGLVDSSACPGPLPPSRVRRKTAADRRDRGLTPKIRRSRPVFIWWADDRRAPRRARSRSSVLPPSCWESAGVPSRGRMNRLAPPLTFAPLLGQSIGTSDRTDPDGKLTQYHDFQRLA